MKHQVYALYNISQTKQMLLNIIIIRT